VPTMAIFSAKAASRADQSRAGLLETRKLVIVLGVAASNGDGKCVAGLDGFALLSKAERARRLGLVADVEEDLVRGERNDDALELTLAGPLS